MSKTSPRRLRVAVVEYLNTKPLIYGLESRPDLFDLEFHVPSRCADLLHSGAVDMAMLSSIEYCRNPHYEIVPSVAVASKGAVRSVAIYLSRPMHKIKAIALDSSSLTYVALLKLLSKHRFGLDPDYATLDPDLTMMLRKNDAALMIGDRSLFARPGLYSEKIDLGAEWPR